MSVKVAVVSGSYKGIGLSIVKGLAQKFDGVVYITARNINAGNKALESLINEGINQNKLNVHQLDIDSDESVNNFAEYLKNKYGGIDILVNNAGILRKEDPNALKAKDAQDIINTNYFGTLRLCDSLFPLLRNNSRVVNVASDSGLLSQITNESLKNKYIAPNVTIDDISILMNQYIEARKNGNYKGMGYLENDQLLSYNVSEIGLIAATRIQQKNIDNDKSRNGIIINSMCPGFIETDMTSNLDYGEKLTPEQGAETAIFLAMLTPGFDGEKGVFWIKKKIVDWVNAEYIYSQ